MGLSLVNISDILLIVLGALWNFFKEPWRSTNLTFWGISPVRSDATLENGIIQFKILSEASKDLFPTDRIFHRKILIH